MSARKFKAIRCMQGFPPDMKELYLFAAPADWLITSTTIDWYDPSIPDDNWEKQGYQRKPSRNHINKIIRFLEGSGEGQQLQTPLFPTAILLSVRGKDKVKFQPVDLEGKPMQGEDPSSRVGILEIDPNIPIYVVDGQHRIEGIKGAKENNKRFEQFYLPVSLLVCDAPTEEEAKIQEMLHFLVVNKTAKSVKTDLAEELLEKIYKIRPELIRETKMLQDARTISERLELVKIIEKYPPWTGRIAKPNERRTGVKVANQQQFAKSLRHIMVLDLNPNQLAEFVISFWDILSQLLPEAFKEPNKFVIQKAVGFGALHRVLPSLWTYWIVWDKNERKQRLKALLEKVEPFFTDPSYWKKGGPASQYSSEGGYKIHSEIIKEEIKTALEVLKS